ncbi:alanine racemase [Purpureocillium lilacinum]|uniref:Alanine racemase n=1 Tax=Purpureocillium lilacinum TaxID=33203 RepID=A0A179H3M2_PURLI|nr:alanine racemase [Purpureocillium lilacinum]
MPPAKKAKSRTAASAAPASGGEKSEGDKPDKAKPKTDKEKALLRRQQVRRAQIEHRQRKANYVKQLELDVSQLRDLVALEEHDGKVLHRENEEIIAILRLNGVGRPSGVQQPAHHAQQPPFIMRPEGAGSVPGQGPVEPIDPMMLDPSAPGSYAASSVPDAAASPEMFSGIDLDDWTVTLSVDRSLGTPCFHVSSGSSGDGSVASALTPPKSATGEAQLTPAQEQRAINFILALEHVCWNHFRLGDFPCHDHSEECEEDNGHTLMASAYCMASAPESIYADSQPLARDYPKNKPASAAPTTAPSSPPPSFSWPAVGITLDSLHGLAQSLNPGDQEIAPVQAWFELASRYPVDMLLDATTLDALQCEFKNVVRCVSFGAAIERMAFESVLAKVLGPSDQSLNVPV